MAVAGDVPLLRVRTLGPFQAYLGDREIPRDAWRNRAARRLLLRLAGAHRGTIRREEAMDLLWPEQDPASAANSLKATVYLLRRVLEPQGTAARERYIVHDRQIVGLNTDHLAPLDCDRFERAAAESRSGDAASLARAAGLYTGPFLEDDPYEDWAVPRRAQLAARHQRLLLDLAAAQRQRKPAEALATLRRLLEADPCHEAAARQMIQIYLALDDHGAAMRCYRALESALRRDLDVRPAAETQELGRVLLARQVAPAASAAPVRPARKPAPPFRSRDRLIGRAAELRRLGGALRALEGGPRAVFVGGEPGIGKTRLAQEFANRALARGCTLLYGQARPEEQTWPYGPIIHALAHYCSRQDRRGLQADLLGCATLSRLLPELADLDPGLVPESPAGAEQERRLLHRAVTTFLGRIAGGAPLILLLDDLQWTGETTIALLRDLLAGPDDLPLLLVATFRDGEVDAAHPLARLASALERTGQAERCILGPLSHEEARALASQIGPQAARVPDTVLRRAGGNPFLTQGVVQGRAHDTPDHAAGSAGVSDLVAETIQQRVESLPAPAPDLLRAAAVVGAQIPRGLLQLMTGRSDDEVLAALAAAQRAQVLRPSAEGYQFVHELIRDVLYRSLDDERRERLHGQAGEALEVLPGVQHGRLEALAYHYGRSPQHRGRAIDLLWRAGREAARLYANQEAAQHLQRALALLDDLSPSASRDDQRRAILAALSDLQVLLGEHQAATSSAQQALALARDPEQRAALLRRIGTLASGRGEADAWTHFAAAEALLSARRGGAEWGRLRLAMAHALIDRDEAARAQPLLEEALRLFQAGAGGVGDLGDLAGAYNALGNALMTRDAEPVTKHRAMDCWHQALALWEASGDLDGQARARHNLGYGHLWLGEWDAAISCFRETDALGARSGNTTFGAFAQLNLGMCLLTLGRWAEALHATQLAVERAERVGREHLVAQACANAGLICEAIGDLERAERWFERCSLLGGQLGAPTFRWIALRGLGQVAEARGLLALACERYRMAIEVGSPAGKRYWLTPLIELARVTRLVGGSEAVEYRRQAQQALADLREDWAVLLKASLSLEEGLALADAGEPAAAAASLGEAIALADCVQTEPADSCALRLTAATALGALELRQPGSGAGEGHPAKRTARLEATLQQAESFGRHACLLDAQLALAEAYLACEEDALAEILVAKAQAGALGRGYAFQAAMSAVLQALLARRRGHKEADVLVQAAMEGVIALGMPSYHMQALRLLGTVDL